MINVKNLVLGIGIVVIFALALWQGVEAFYPSSKYDDFCITNYPSAPQLKPDTICNPSKSLQNQEQQCYQRKGFPIYEFI